MARIHIALAIIRLYHLTKKKVNVKKNPIETCSTWYNLLHIDSSSALVFKLGAEN